MSTNSRIGIVYPDGTVKSIYCHWDGYIAHNGKILLNYYNTAEKVEALLALGNLSSLDERCDKPEGHTFDTRVDGYSVAYGRDRGEFEDNEASISISLVEFMMDEAEEYVYLFQDGKWMVGFYPNVRNLNPLDSYAEAKPPRPETIVHR